MKREIPKFGEGETPDTIAELEGSLRSHPGSQVRFHEITERELELFINDMYVEAQNYGVNRHDHTGKAEGVERRIEEVVNRHNADEDVFQILVEELHKILNGRKSAEENPFIREVFGEKGSKEHLEKYISKITKKLVWSHNKRIESDTELPKGLEAPEDNPHELPDFEDKL